MTSEYLVQDLTNAVASSEVKLTMRAADCLSSWYCSDSRRTTLIHDIRSAAASACQRPPQQQQRFNVEMYSLQLSEREYSGQVHTQEEETQWLFPRTCCKKDPHRLMLSPNTFANYVRFPKTDSGQNLFCINFQIMTKFQ